jgi:hypothetical protein
MHRMTTIFGNLKRGFTVFILMVLSASAFGRVWEVRPTEDYRAILPNLQPGDELVLHEGVYEGSVRIRLSGTPEKPIIIRGHGEGQARPVLNFEGGSANLWEISGDHLVVRYLEFRSRRSYAIRVGRASDLTIEDCIFRENGGGDISANTAPVDGLRIRRNLFVGSRRTPIYIGNHDGKLPITQFVFEGNVIDGSQIIAEDVIGYGIQLKLNVTGGLIRGNFIANTRGPGIMVYGATNAVPEAANVVERNIVTGSRNNPGIVVGGGPSVVRENIVLSCPAGGISVINYGRRGLLDQIVVSGNTAVANHPFEFSLATPIERTEFKNNRAFPRPGATAFRNTSSISAENNISSSAGTELMENAERFRTLLPTPAQVGQALRQLGEGPHSEEAIRLLLARLNE